MTLPLSPGEFQLLHLVSHITQIRGFAPSNFSWRAAAYVDSYSGASVDVVIVSTVSHGGLCVSQFPVCDVYNSYLPGRGDTMIKKVVYPGRGSAIALRLSDPCEFLKCGNLDCIICGSGGLRSRSPLIKCQRE
ncbi:unnamed protein product [Pleuronectes platessa]|uniref:Uncharacterized protein n=1 Tax=Pleuronectes platessa TaxID=8262 RepID=A0A9N7YKI3_PLEPL|nr:unnamed protein product [Pleuronectes platessa]